MKAIHSKASSWDSKDALRAICFKMVSMKSSDRVHCMAAWLTIINVAAYIVDIVDSRITWYSICLDFNPEMI